MRRLCQTGFRRGPNSRIRSLSLMIMMIDSSIDCNRFLKLLSFERTAAERRKKQSARSIYPSWVFLVAGVQWFEEQLADEVLGLERIADRVVVRVVAGIAIGIVAGAWGESADYE